MARSRSASTHAPDPAWVQIPPDVALADRLRAFRLALEQQHRFRSEQLASLVEKESADSADPSGPEDQQAVCARREVDAVLRAGARRALIDIELALARLDTGRYGFCRSCGTPIPLALLEAIPKTTLCLACRCHEECSSGEQAPRRRMRRFARSPRTGSVSPARQESSGRTGRSRTDSLRHR